jgi:hypothetical protein
VFYGLNNSSINQAGTSSTAQNAAPAVPAPNPAAPPQTTAQQTSPTAAPPGMRDVTPHPNTSPGVTTGAAPTRPQGAPAPAPTGQSADRPGNPPQNNN